MNYTPYQLAKFSGLSRSYVHRRIKDWKIETTVGVRSGHTEYLISEKEAQRFFSMVREVRERMEERRRKPAEDLEESQPHRDYHTSPSAPYRYWELALNNDKYLRKPITPESRLARIFQIVERIKQRDAA